MTRNPTALDQHKRGMEGPAKPGTRNRVAMRVAMHFYPALAFFSSRGMAISKRF